MYWSQHEKMKGKKKYINRICNYGIRLIWVKFSEIGIIGRGKTYCTRATKRTTPKTCCCNYLLKFVKPMMYWLTSRCRSSMV